MIGRTNSQTGGGVKGEKVNILLQTNQKEHDGLIGATITVTYNGNPTQYTWEGKEITVTVPPLTEYAIEVSEVEGYATPSKFTAEAVEGNARMVAMTYQAEKVKVTLVASNGTDMTGTDVTIDGKEYIYNGTLEALVAYGKEYTIVAGTKEGLSTPQSVTYTASQQIREITLNYYASGLVVYINSNQLNDATIAQVRATVSYSGLSVETASGMLVTVPNGAEVTVTFPDVADYNTPSPITFTQGTGLTEKSVTYTTEVVTVNATANDGESMDGQVVSVVKQEEQRLANGVYIQDIEGKCWKESEWDGTKIANGIAVVDNKCSFVIALKNAASTTKWSLVSNAAVSGILTTTNSDVAVTDFNGKQNTGLATDVVDNAENYPAMHACKLFVFPNGENGYMSAAGEWKVALNYKPGIDSAIAKCGGTALSDYNWTSTQHSSGNSWYIRWTTGSIAQGGHTTALYPRAFLSLNPYEKVLLDPESHEVTNSKAIFKASHGTQYEVSMSGKEGYKTPASQTFVADSVSRNIDMEYKTETVTVNVSSLDNKVDGYEVVISKPADTIGKATKYTKLDYIESSGTQYIDTGFKPNQDTRVVLSAHNLSSDSGWTFGEWNSVSPNQYGFSCKANNSFRYGTENVVLSDVPIGDFEVDFNKSSYKLNETEGAFTSQTFQSSYNMYLFAINAAGTVSGGKFTGRFYSCQIYDNDTLVRDYIPAKRADGICGLYDAVNDSFYPSNGTANFIGGTEAVEIIGTQTSVTGTYKIAFDEIYNVTASEVSGYATPVVQTFTASQDNRTVNIVYEANKFIDLSKQDVHGNKIKQTTANCYVVSEAGDYMIPIAYGAAIKNGQVNAASFTNNGGANSHYFVNYLGNAITSPYVETDTGSVATSVQMSISDTENAVTNLGIINGDGCKYISFSVPSVPKTGANAVISVKDADGVIMWNWHIWLWEDDLTPVEITNATSVAYNIMPVNLGSKWDEDAKTHIKNWFYQFGRPTPMLCPSAYNSTSNHASYGALSYAAASITLNIQSGIKNPATFFGGDSSYDDNWFQTNSNKTYNLWDAACTSFGNSDNNVVKTIYDPCPIGFKMPNGNTFTYFSTSNVEGRFANGWKFKRYSGDTVGVFFPASGFRNRTNGSLSNVGTYGYVWFSSAQSLNRAYYLYLYTSEVKPQSSERRAYGFSVRPVTDTPLEGQTKITKIRIDQTITDPEAMITRIVDLGGIEAVRANSHRYTGTVVDGVMQLKQLKDTDGTKYLDGSAATLTTQGVDVWMKLPQFYWKCVQVETDVFDFYVAYGAKPDDTYKTWDGKDLIGVYKGYVYNGNLYSISGVVSTKYLSQNKSKSYAQARGEGYTPIKWKHHCMMAMLYYTQYGNTNSQQRIGNGTSYGTEEDGYAYTGVRNSLGMTDTSYIAYNYSTVNYWGLEDWWGVAAEALDNIVVINKEKFVVTEDDGSTRTVNLAFPDSGFASKMLFGENIDLITTSTNGSATTGFCDKLSIGTGENAVYRSYETGGTDSGISYLYSGNAPSANPYFVGTRLAFRGDYTIID